MRRDVRSPARLDNEPRAAIRVGPVVPAHQTTGASSEAVDVGVVAPLAAWVRRKKGEPALRSLCAAAGIDPPLPTSSSGSLPVHLFNAFLSALRDQLESDDAFLGLLGTTDDVPRGAPWLRWFATPGFLYRSRARGEWITGGTGSITCTGRGLCSATMRYAGTGGRFACLFRQARLMHLPTALALPPGIVRQTECLARGDDACAYTVHWHGRPRLIPAIVAAGLTVAGFAWVPASSWIASGVALLAAGLTQAVETRRVRAANRITAATFGSAFREAASALAAPSPAVEPAASTAGSAPEEGAVFRQEGNFWRITFEGKTILMQRSRGLSLLVHLLRNPGKEIHVAALDGLIPSDAAMPPRSASTVDGEITHDLGDAGEILDPQAKTAYRRRMADLRSVLEDAEACNDPGRASAARAELEAITEQLSEAIGLAGRSRRASSSADRARVAISRRIRAAIAQIAKDHPSLGAHLTSSIRTGYYCSYEPADTLVWQT